MEFIYVPLLPIMSAMERKLVGKHLKSRLFYEAVSKMDKIKHYCEFTDGEIKEQNCF